MSDQPQTEERKAFRAGPIQRLAAEQMRRQMFFPVPHGITADEAMASDYLRHYASQISVNDLIELVSESGAFDILARVVSVKPGVVKLRPLLAYIAEPVEAEAPAPVPGGRNDISVEFNSKQRWRLITDGGEVIAKDFHTREEAIEAKRAHLLGIAA
jgi:hypothetical protein